MAQIRYRLMRILQAAMGQLAAALLGLLFWQWLQHDIVLVLALTVLFSRTITQLEIKLVELDEQQRKSGGDK